jgi:hypothetical protein|tara:strand:+ start:1000 stop:1482 length:483 start_codon:yes stop_codon:yes gene_type:complete
MPEKVTWEEKVVELAILKAKEVLQEAEHLGTIKLDEPLTGEEVKVKRPKKNPSEEPLPKTNNLEGKEDKVNDGTMKKALNAVADAAEEFVRKYKMPNPSDMAATIDVPRQSAEVEESLDAITELSTRLRNADGNEALALTTSIQRHLDKVKRLRDVPTRT